MKFSSSLLQNLVESLATLPSIGKKTALRLALHILDYRQKGVDISTALGEVNKIKTCQICNNYSDHEICGICSDESRRKGTICVVESVIDVMAIEDTQQYNGQFHVLGGVINPIEGIGPDQLNIDGLVQRVEKEDIKEIIMAISPTIEGETTIYYISKKMEILGVAISQIARGVSFGGELEYADAHTLGRSIQTRTPYKLSVD